MRIAKTRYGLAFLMTALVFPYDGHASDVVYPVCKTHMIPANEVRALANRPPYYLGRSLFKEPVGHMAPNRIHDISVLQAAFVNIETSDGKQFWRGSLTGEMRPPLQALICQFQKQMALPETGVIRPNSVDEKMLVGLLPDRMRDMRALPDSTAVYVIYPRR